MVGFQPVDKEDLIIVQGEANQLFQMMRSCKAGFMESALKLIKECVGHTKPLSKGEPEQQQGNPLSLEVGEMTIILDSPRD